MFTNQSRSIHKSVAFSLSVLMAFMLSFELCLQSTAADKFGVGFVPKMGDGDATEKDMYQFVAAMPEVDQLFVINDGTHMLSTLTSLKSHGRRPKYLILAGHGSRETPALKWGKDDMIPEEIDLEWNKKELLAAQRLLKNPQHTKTTPAQLKNIEANLTRNISLLKSAHGVMAPEGVVLLVNCSAAATPKGQKYVRDFGELLLGEDGGWIIASRNDIEINLRSSVLQRAWTEILNRDVFYEPDFLMQADWQAFRIEGKKKKVEAWKKMIGLWHSSSGTTIRVSWSSGNRLTGVIVAVPKDSTAAVTPGNLSFANGIPKSDNSMHSDSAYCYAKKKDGLSPKNNCPMDLTISDDGQKIQGKVLYYQYYDGSKTWDAGQLEVPFTWTRIGD